MFPWMGGNRFVHDAFPETLGDEVVDSSFNSDTSRFYDGLGLLDDCCTVTPVMILSEA